jgi:hypothetical protein
MKPTVISATSVDQIERKIQDALNEGLKPTLAIVFSSIAHDLKEVGAAFAKQNIDVFGASSSGEILNDEVHEESIVAMLLDINRDFYRLKLSDGTDKTSYQVGQSVGEWAKTIYDNPALMVMPSNLVADGEAILHGIIDEMGRQVPIFGGVAGDDWTWKGNFVFDGSQVSPNGVMTVLFDGNAIALQGIAVHGWKAIGTPKTVTKAQGNIVYEIDNMPTGDVYAKYFNFTDVFDSAPYPLLLSRDDGSQILRGVFVVNKDKSFVYKGSVPEGAKVRFAMPPGTEIIDHAIEQMSKFSQGISQPKGIVLFSCKARHIALGPMIEDEVAGIHKIWDAPMAGLFCYGEFGPSPQGWLDFHNYTVVPVLIHEK